MPRRAQQERDCKIWSKNSTEKGAVGKERAGAPRERLPSDVKTRSCLSGDRVAYLPSKLRS